MDKLSAVVASLVVLSMGVERIVEILKGMFDKLAASAVAMQIVATVAGAVIAFATGPDKFLHDPDAVCPLISPQRFALSILLGLMASGGSAFWNHILDILGAIKTVKERLADAQQPALQQAKPQGAPVPAPAGAKA